MDDLTPFAGRGGCLPHVETAFYFSGVTYTTLGYGDVVLTWRMLGPIEGLMGVLMCGLSTDCFFVVVSRIHQSRPVPRSADAQTGSKLDPQLTRTGLRVI